MLWIRKYLKTDYLFRNDAVAWWDYKWGSFYVSNDICQIIFQVEILNTKNLFNIHCITHNNEIKAFYRNLFRFRFRLTVYCLQWIFPFINFVLRILIFLQKSFKWTQRLLLMFKCEGKRLCGNYFVFIKTIKSFRHIFEHIHCSRLGVEIKRGFVWKLHTLLVN